jgi:hypothetical protein
MGDFPNAGRKKQEFIQPAPPIRDFCPKSTYFLSNQPAFLSNQPTFCQTNPLFCQINLLFVKPTYFLKRMIFYLNQAGFVKAHFGAKAGRLPQDRGILTPIWVN